MELTYTGPPPTEQQVQKGELVVSHVDCDTAPFMWTYADHFTLFDNFFDTVIGPSTPNAIAMIAGQSGETQWVKHPELASNNNYHQRATTGDRRSATLLGVRSGRPYPSNEKQPTESGGARSANPASNLTFASFAALLYGKRRLKTSRPAIWTPPSTSRMFNRTS